MSATDPKTTTEGVLEERRSSPGLLLALLGQEAMRRLRAAHTAVGLSPRQFQLLGLLHDNGAMSQTELGRSLRVAPSVLVTLLNPLEDERLVSRERDAADRRRHVVTLTAAGRLQLDRAAAAQRAVEDELFAGLGDQEREQLAAALVALRDTLAEAGDAACSPPASS
jgi:DNA-binding MarR family transcriptional regulator